MMIAVVKFVFGVMIAVGFLLILGAAGSDCDGKCMENAMPLADVLLYSAGGLFLMAMGALGLYQLNEV
jgi:hypothetical protein